MAYIVVAKEKREILTKFVCDRLNEGDEASEIARKIDHIYGKEIQIGDTVALVRTITKEVIEQGKVNKEKVIAERRRTLERRHGMPLAVEAKQNIKEKILIMLRKGERTSGPILANLFNISQPTADKLKKKVMEDNGITIEEVKRVQNRQGEKSNIKKVAKNVDGRKTATQLARSACSIRDNSQIVVKIPPLDITNKDTITPEPATETER